MSLAWRDCLPSLEKVKNSITCTAISNNQCTTYSNFWKCESAYTRCKVFTTSVLQHLPGYGHSFCTCFCIRTKPSAQVTKLSEEMVHKKKFMLRNFTASALALYYKVIQLRQDNVSLFMTTVCKPSAIFLYWEMFTDHSSSITEGNCTVMDFRQPWLVSQLDFRCNIPYFLDNNTHFFSCEVQNRIFLHLLFSKCINMTFKSTEIPEFNGGPTAVIT